LLSAADALLSAASDHEGLRASIPWFVSLAASKVFGVVWRQVVSEARAARAPAELSFDDLVACVEHSYARWGALWIGLDKSTLQFAELSPLAELLTSESEVECLSKTAGAVGRAKWDSGLVNVSWTKKVVRVVRRFVVLSRVHSDMDALRRNLDVLRSFLPSGEQESMVSLLVHLSDLHDQLQESWNTLTLADLDALAKLAERIDLRIAVLHPQLLECLDSSPVKELLGWLQTMSSDADFQVCCVSLVLFWGGWGCHNAAAVPFRRRRSRWRWVVPNLKRRRSCGW
jgi:hypothetical protein